MNNFAKSTTLILSAFLAINITASTAFCEQEKNIKTTEYKLVQPLEVVAKPQNYLKQKIKVTAVFDKFSTMGLDYKPLAKDSQDYISILIKRDDVKDHTIPLSEMKIFVKRDTAEKELLDISSGEKIEFTGEVISTALNDPWIEIDNIKILNKKAKKEDKKQDKK